MRPENFIVRLNQSCEFRTRSINNFYYLTPFLIFKYYHKRLFTNSYYNYNNYNNYIDNLNLYKLYTFMIFFYIVIRSQREICFIKFTVAMARSCI